MGKKAFLAISGIIIFSGIFSIMIRYYQPVPEKTVKFESFPLQKNDWMGSRKTVPASILEVLKADEIFFAEYVNHDGIHIYLLFEYFYTRTYGKSVHSPRNCLPGSGWVISSTSKRQINSADRSISASRFNLRLQDRKLLMDYWYISRSGETGNEFLLMFDLMKSALVRKPTDVAFVRITADDNPYGEKALDEFEKQFIDEIYNHLPF